MSWMVLITSLGAAVSLQSCSMLHNVIKTNNGQNVCAPQNCPYEVGVVR